MATFDITQVERARRRIEDDAQAMRHALVLAAGALMAHGLVEASAAVLIILDHDFPEHGVRLDGWRTS